MRSKTKVGILALSFFIGIALLVNMPVAPEGLVSHRTVQLDSIMQHTHQRVEQPLPNTVDEEDDISGSPGTRSLNLIAYLLDRLIKGSIF